MRLRYVITDADRFQKDFDSERYRSLIEAVRYSARLAAECYNF
jgi:hypothetical protein